MFFKMLGRAAHVQRVGQQECIPPRNKEINIAEAMLECARMVAPEIHRWIRPASLKQRTVSIFQQLR